MDATTVVTKDACSYDSTDGEQNSSGSIDQSFKNRVPDGTKQNENLSLLERETACQPYQRSKSSEIKRKSTLSYSTSQSEMLSSMDKLLSIFPANRCLRSCKSSEDIPNRSTINEIAADDMDTIKRTYSEKKTRMGKSGQNVNMRRNKAVLCLPSLGSSGTIPGTSESDDSMRNGIHQQSTSPNEDQSITHFYFARIGDIGIWNKDAFH